MENKVYENMINMGWNLGNNNYEDFESALQTHIDKMEYMLDYHYSPDGARIDLNNWTAYIGNGEIREIFEFMLDFVYSVEQLDRIEKAKEAK